MTDITSEVVNATTQYSTLVDEQAMEYDLLDLQEMKL